MPDHPSRFARLKALASTPAGLLTLSSGRDGIAMTPTGPGAFAGSSMFGFPRSSYVDGYFFTLQNASYAYMWQTQPAVRSVIGVLAGNFAQVSLKLYEEGKDGKESEDTTHPAIKSIRRPNDWQDDAELIEALASDFFIFDNAYLVKIRPEGATRTTFIRIPAYAMGVRGANRLRPDGYRIVYADGTYEALTPDQVVHWRGYNALDPRTGWSKMETLRQELISEATRIAADIDFNRGGRVKGGIIQRPMDAPEWSPAAAERFEEGWAARAQGANAGRSPVLEDGMEWIDAGITPREAEIMAARQFTLSYVCHMYGIHPALMGVYASEANLEEARSQLYEDVLPPLMRRLSGALTRSVCETEYNDTRRSFRFDLKEKLEGNLIERLQMAVTITGGPVMTRNEVRAEFFGLGPIKGGDELITPLNVLAGKPSPNTMPPPDPNTPAQDGSHRTGGPNVAKAITPADGEIYTKAVARRTAAATRRVQYAKDMTRVMRRHFNRQADSMQGKAETAVDTDRWDSELAADILAVTTKAVQHEGDVVAGRLMGTFDMERAQAYLADGAKAAAAAINATTQAQIETAKDAQKADGPTVAQGVLLVAASGRAEQIGKSMATAMTGFATNEAARQNPGETGTIRLKEWVPSGPDSRHAELAGHATPVESTFSNGGHFPGDPTLGTDATAGCACTLDVY